MTTTPNEKNAVDYAAIVSKPRAMAEIFPEIATLKNSGAEIMTRPPGELTPKKPNPHYEFQKEMLKVSMLWLYGMKPGLMLTGPTGSGKTSFITELCARTGHELMMVQCHQDLEFQELIGRVTLNKDGSTGWIDGLAIVAAKRGAILLLDEVNFLRPGTLGGMNALLDGNPYFIPETGEIITPHKDFRIAATGNDVHGESGSTFRGTQRQNQAFLDRFIGYRVEYMDEIQEANIIAKMYPVPQTTLKIMLATAKAIRAMNNDGKLQETLSSRVLFTWASIMSGTKKNDAEQARNLPLALEWALGFRASPSAWADIKSAVESNMKRLMPVP